MFNNFFKNKLSYTMIMFLVFNALKLVFFDYFMASDIKNLPCFLLVKFFINILFVSFMFLTLFKFKLNKTAIFVYVFQFIYLIAHVCYFKYFHNYLHIMQTLTLFNEGTTALTNLYFFLDASVLLLFIDLPFFIYLIYKKDTTVNFKYLHYILGGLCVSLISYSYIVLFLPTIIHPSSSPLNTIPSESIIVRKYGTLTNDLFSFAFNKDEKKMIQNLVYGKKIEGISTNNEPANIIILQLESIDANVVNAKYNGKYIAPYLHALSKKCVYYPYTMSYHMGGGTSDSEFSIINSIEPLQVYPAMKLSNYDYHNSFIKQLNNNGYTSLAFHGNVANYFNRDSAFFGIGFEKFYDIHRMHLRNKGWGASDEDVLNYAKNTLSKTSNPFLAYVITMTSHASFTNASNYYTNHDYDNISDELVRNYFNSVSYVDVTLKNFISDIRDKMPNTYIFIWGDHTPSIERPLYSQASLSFDGKYFEFVPLFILTPDNKVYQESEKVASFLDIAPTILNASGVTYTIFSNGDDLLNFDNEEVSPIPFKGSFYSKKILYQKILNK